MDEELQPLIERLQAACLARHLLVVTAESCTGGGLVDSLTDLPGSSGYVLGGIVAYADRVKVDQLGVTPAALAAHGAVSAHVARAMALGARARFGADLALAITGVAGPDGGTAAKPVGLTYLALAGPDGIEVRRRVWSGDRSANKRSSVRAAVELLLEAAEATEATDATEATGRSDRNEPSSAGVG